MHHTLHSLAMIGLLGGSLLVGCAHHRGYSSAGCPSGTCSHGACSVGACSTGSCSTGACGPARHPVSTAQPPNDMEALELSGTPLAKLETLEIPVP